MAEIIKITEAGAVKEGTPVPNQGKQQQFKLSRSAILMPNMIITVKSKDGKFNGQMPMSREMAQMFGSDLNIYVEAIPRDDGTLHLLKLLDNQLW